MSKMEECIYCHEEDAVAVLDYGEGRFCHVGANCLKNLVFVHKFVIINTEDPSHPFVTDALWGSCSECVHQKKCLTERTLLPPPDERHWCAGFKKKL